MSTRLVILGMLRQQPLHGYELKQIIEDRMGDWTSIAFGSIYFALGKLAEEGLIEKIATEQAGGRPSRSIYQITGAGQGEFMRLLRAVWEQPERQFFALDIGLFFARSLSHDDLVAYLEKQIAAVEKNLAYLSEHRDHQLTQPYVPARANAIFDHSYVHFEAELTWLKDVLGKVVSGEYD